MKILLLGDASHYHATLAKGLAALGHDVTVASDGSRWMETPRDIDISRHPSRMGGAFLWTRLNTTLKHRLKGYDVVQIHNPVFLNLKPGRVKEIFNRLRRDNGAVFLTALGTDPVYIDMCLAKDCELRYTEFMVDGYPSPYFLSHPGLVDEWTIPALRDLTNIVYDNVDGIVSALYEYHLACARRVPLDRLAYGGIPIDCDLMNKYATSSENQKNDDKINILIACHKNRESEKGIDQITHVVERLTEKNSGKVHLNKIQNVPGEQFFIELSKADIVVDQIYSYTPATTALMAMAMGKAVISGGEEDFYRFIGENTLRPIINVVPGEPEALEHRLQEIVDTPELLDNIKSQGREFVKRHNDMHVVARRFEEFWERRLRL